MHTFWQKLARALLLSSLALKASPRVQAKMLATGLVLVGLPFWYCRQCRVTVPAHIPPLTFNVEAGMGSAPAMDAHA